MFSFVINPNTDLKKRLHLGILTVLDMHVVCSGHWQHIYTLQKHVWESFACTPKGRRALWTSISNNELYYNHCEQAEQRGFNFTLPFWVYQQKYTTWPSSEMNVMFWSKRKILVQEFRLCVSLWFATRGSTRQSWSCWQCDIRQS